MAHAITGGCHAFEAQAREQSLPTGHAVSIACRSSVWISDRFSNRSRTMTYFVRRNAALATLMFAALTTSAYAQNAPDANNPTRDTTANSPLGPNSSTGTTPSPSGASPMSGAASGSSRNTGSNGTDAGANSGQPTTSDMKSEQMRNPSRSGTMESGHTAPNADNGSMSSDKRDDESRRRSMNNGSTGSTPNNSSMDTMEPTGAGKSSTSRPARSDRG